MASTPFSRASGGGLFAVGRRFGAVGAGFGGGQDEAGHAGGVPAIEGQGDVAAHGQAGDDGRLGEAQAVEQGDGIVGELVHGVGAFGGVAVAVAAQVGRDDAGGVE